MTLTIPTVGAAEVSRMLVATYALAHGLTPDQADAIMDRLRARAIADTPGGIMRQLDEAAEGVTS